MGLWEYVRSLVTGVDSTYEIEELEKAYRNLYLRSLAVGKSVEFVARVFSLSEFQRLKRSKLVRDKWSHLLNVQPNRNETGPEFWQAVVHRLLNQNEALIIVSDDNQLFLADNYVRKTYALYDDVFEGVTVRGYLYHRQFKMSKVIFLQYNNNRLDSYIKALFDDYQALHERLTQAISRNNQIRGMLKITGSGRFDQKETARLQGYAAKLFKAFSEKSVAIVPENDHVKYEEISGTARSNSNISMDELGKLRHQLDAEVSDILGIPIAVLKGDMAEYSNAIEAFYQTCLAPLNKKVEAALEAKILSYADYLAGDEIRIKGANSRDIFKLSESIDKITASGNFNTNEVRKAFYYDPIEGGDKFVRTKNYEEVS